MFNNGKFCSALSCLCSGLHTELLGEREKTEFVCLFVLGIPTGLLAHQGIEGCLYISMQYFKVCIQTAVTFQKKAS